MNASDVNFVCFRPSVRAHLSEFDQTILAVIENTRGFLANGVTCQQIIRLIDAPAVHGQVVFSGTVGLALARLRKAGLVVKGKRGWRKV